jgi:hypothetical protein
MKTPTTLNDIKLYHLELIELMNLQDDKDQRLKEIAILLDTDFETLYSLPLNDLNTIIKDIQWFYHLKPEDITPKYNFEYQGTKYQIQTDYGKLSGGQLIDIENFSKNFKNNWTLTKYIIAVCMYKEGDEKSYYKSQEEFNKSLEIVNELPLDIVYGFLSFFLHKKESLKTISDLTLQAKELIQNMDTYTKTSQESMDFYTVFGTFLGKILLGLMMLLGWMHMTFFLPCKSIWKRLLSKKK